MKTHDEIRKLLAAYCGGDLAPDEQALVEEHLRSCPDCAADLEDLKTTLDLVRSTPTAEAPPWLATRIMARVRDEATHRKSWMQRLFFPLHVKVPLELMALALICVSSYYLTRTVGTELRQSPPGEQAMTAPAPVQPVPSKSEQAPALPETPSPRREAPLPPPQASVERIAPPFAGQTPPPLPSPAPRQAAPSGAEPVKGGSAQPPAPSYSATEQKRTGAVPEAQPAAPSPAESRDRAMSAASAPGKKAAGNHDKAKSEALRSTPATSMKLHLSVDDPELAAETISRAITRSGGSLVEDEFATPPRHLKARIPARRLPELLEHLKQLGRVAEHPATSGMGGTVMVEINW